MTNGQVCDEIRRVWESTGQRISYTQAEENLRRKRPLDVEAERNVDRMIDDLVTNPE